MFGSHRIAAPLVILALLCAPALAGGKDASDKSGLSGGGKASASADGKGGNGGDAKSGDSGKAAGSGPQVGRAEADLRHKVVSGTWSGTVEEVGVEPYRMVMNLNSDATGDVSYEGFECSARLEGIAGGPQLRYRETITAGRDVCSDGTVHLDLRGAVLLWTWYTPSGEVQAAATLRRVTGEMPPARPTESVTGDN